MAFTDKVIVKFPTFLGHIQQAVTNGLRSCLSRVQVDKDFLSAVCDLERVS